MRSIVLAAFLLSGTCQTLLGSHHAYSTYNDREYLWKSINYLHSTVNYPNTKAKTAYLRTELNSPIKQLPSGAAALEYGYSVIAALCSELIPLLLADHIDRLYSALKSTIEENNSLNKNTIDDLINKALLEFIRQRAYACTYELTHTMDLATRIATVIHNKAQDSSQRKGYLSGKDVAEFTGTQLLATVQSLIAQHTPAKPTTTQTPTTTVTTTIVSNNPIQTPTPSNTAEFLSDECCVCMEKFEASNRIILKPCGHDICKTCAHDYFITHNKTTCPLCRATIDKDTLIAMLK